MKTLCISVLTAIWGVQLLALSGCAVPGGNISQKGVVSVQRVPSAEADILWANVYQIEDSLMVVRGRVCRRGYSSLPLLVHVDAVVLSGDGEILQEAPGRDVWVRRRLVGKGLNYVNYGDFEIRLPVAPPEGGTVKLVCHAVRGSGLCGPQE